MFRKKSDLRVKKVSVASMVIMALIISGMLVVTPIVKTAEGQETAGGEYGGNLRVALKVQPNTLNPLNSSMNEPATQVMDLIYDFSKNL